jgi:phage gp29-like protein
MDEPKIEKPVTEEIARPETPSDPRVRQYMTDAFTDILIPQDTVLRQRGRDYKIYREVLRDDQCKSAFQQRQDAQIAAEWEVEPASDAAIDVSAADFIREQLNSIEWDRAYRGMHFGVWYGYSVGECLWDYDGRYVVLKDIRVRERERFAFDAKRRLYLRSSTGDELMPERKFWVVNTGADHDDEPYGLGLAHYCYWPVFFKRNDIKFWLVFQEKFAAPTVKGKTPAGVFNDPAQRAAILAQLRAFATDTAIVVPEGVEVELLEATRSGSTSYKELADAMDAALAKIILSQTMTTDNGSSRSQAEVHEGVRDMVVKSDADLICNSFNRQPVRWLTEWNFPGAKPPRVWRNTEPDEDLNRRADRDSKIYTLGFEPDEEYLSEVYGETYAKWKKRAIEHGMTPQEVAEAAAQEFAELGAIAAAKGARRLDQNELVEASRRFAHKYQNILGKRVQQLVDFAETSGDYETFRRNLLAMMAEAPPSEMADPAARSGIVARILGRFRAQR